MRIKFIHLWILLFVISACRTAHVTSVDTNEYHFAPGKNQARDSAVYNLISPYKLRIDSEMNVVIGSSMILMTKAEPEGLLGNFTSDLLLKYAKDSFPATNIDFAFFNNGGFRAPLPKGVITKRNLFELMPFDNELVFVELNGDQAMKVFQHIASKGGQPVAGIRMEIKGGKPVNVMINGVAWKQDAHYTMLTSDYLANGGEDLFFLKEIPSKALNMKIRDALIFAMSAQPGRLFTATLDGRIQKRD